MRVAPQTSPDPEPSIIWRLGAWLLRREAKRANLSRSVVASRVHHIGFEIEKRIQRDFDARPTSNR